MILFGGRAQGVEVPDIDRYAMMPRDIIDPDASSAGLDDYAQWHEMIQIPVPRIFPTPFGGVNSRSLLRTTPANTSAKMAMARSVMGGSHSIRMAWAQDSLCHALEVLASAYSNRIFEPACLTEDYENGFRVARLGLSQKFIPILTRSGRAIATREYFPAAFLKRCGATSALDHRHGLQSQSWPASGKRRGMPIGSGATVLSVGTSLGCRRTCFSFTAPQPWRGPFQRIGPGGWETKPPGSLPKRRRDSPFRYCTPPSACGVARGYTDGDSPLAVPVRVVAANWINCFATLRAVSTYAFAKSRGMPLRWVKTEHAYPNRAALMTDRKKLGEILAGAGGSAQEQLETALASKPLKRRLGEHLLMLGLIGEDDLYTGARARENHSPIGRPEPSSVSVAVTRALPAAMARKWRVLPFRIAGRRVIYGGQ